VGAAILLVVGVLAGTALPAAAAPTGAISGHVTDGGGQPVAGICVGVDGGNVTTTDANGDYQIEGLDTGSYTIQFNCWGDPSYVRQWYSGAADQASATPVAVTDTQTTSGVDAQLVAAASISGTVTSAGGTPLSQICVSAFRQSNNGWQWLAGSTTAPDGTYTAGGISAGEVRVQFQDCNSTGHYVEEWWDDKPTFDDATPITLAAGESRSGLDASLTAGGAVTGTVTGPTGDPLGNVCVNAVDVNRGVAYANSAPDGTYTLDRIPPGPITVLFQDCNHAGPYADQWWDHVADQSAATTITVQSGVTTPGIDARLALASVISGHVYDEGNTPLENVCVAAYGDSTVGGSARTASDGSYLLPLRTPGSYAVQFVDCSSTPAHSGEWWDDQPTEATATRVAVAAEANVGGIDAHLAAGVVGSISGHVTNVAGVAMSTSCAIAYIPDAQALVSPVAADGSYAIANAAPGSYFVAFFDCANGGPVTNPTTGAATYVSVWAPNQPVIFSGGPSPDPLVAGAQLVTVASGQALTLDHCFGCDAIDITSLTAGDGRVSVAFTTPALYTGVGDSLPANALDPPVPTYAFTATCTSNDGGAPGTVSGNASALVVTGLTNGKTYSCTVTAADGAATVGASVAASVTLGGGTTPVQPSTPAAGTAPAATLAGEGGMARTGTDTATLLRFALALAALGGVLIVASRRHARLQQD